MPWKGFPQKENSPSDVATQAHASKEKNVEDLEGRVCYFSLTGNLALKAYADSLRPIYSDNQEKLNKAVKKDLENRLLFALLMFDTVVIHCSDPLRERIVCEVLEENREFIQRGSICFLFSDSITDIETDFEKYIERKRNQYNEGYFTTDEFDSLNRDFMNEAYYRRVKDLLKLTQIMVRKPIDSKFSFKTLIEGDLREAEQVVISGKVNDRIKLRNVNLTLYQLLHLQRDDSPRAPKFILDEDTVDKVEEALDTHLKGNKTISRTAIVSAIKATKRTRAKKQQRTLLDAITMRMDVLYCRMNSGDRLILEFHPSFEKRSAYRYAAFKEYLKAITGEEVQLTRDIVARVLDEKEELKNFRLLYLSCITDSFERERLVGPTEDLGYLKSAIEDNKVTERAALLFNSIQKNLMSGSKAGSR